MAFSNEALKLSIYEILIHVCNQHTALKEKACMINIVMCIAMHEAVCKPSYSYS